MKRFLLIQLVVLFAISGCRILNSDTKSLGNIARDGKALAETNVCKGENPDYAEFELFWEEGAIVVENESRKAQLKDTIRESLSAVPLGLQAWFFAKGGQLVFTDNAEQKCGEPAEKKLKITDRIEGYHACYVMKKKSDNETIFPVLYLNSNPEQAKVKFADAGEAGDLDLIKTDIHHSVVRMFGYLFSTVISNLSMSSDNKHFVYGNNPDPQFQQAKKHLAFYFLMDIARSKKGENPMNMTEYSHLLDANFNKLIEPFEMSQWTDRWKQYEAARRNGNPAKLELLEDYIFAEAFDSWYCSTETRKTMVLAGKAGKFNQRFLSA